jgi:hypothetical protein
MKYGFDYTMEVMNKLDFQLDFLDEKVLVFKKYIRPGIHYHVDLLTQVGKVEWYIIEAKHGSHGIHSVQLDAFEEIFESLNDEQKEVVLFNINWLA